MTAVLERSDSPSQWGSMPGWSIVADMTPPELINLRWLAVLRRRILAVLVLVAVLCGAAYFYAWSRNDAANADAAAASDETFSLMHASSSYAGITRIESTVSAINTQIAGVMTSDIDLAHVIAAIRQALPASMTIQSLSVTINPGTTTAAAGLDASGHAQIGTVSIGGGGRSLDDLPTFVERLTMIPGFINVLPSSNQVLGKVASFSLTAQLTDQLYSHRFDASKTGGH